MSSLTATKPPAAHVVSRPTAEAGPRTPRKLREISAAQLGEQLHVRGGSRGPLSAPAPRWMRRLHNQQSRNMKPWGGLWTSTLSVGEHGPGSEWVSFCADDGFNCRVSRHGGERTATFQGAWALNVRPDARILLVDGIRDLNAIVRRHPHTPAHPSAVLREMELDEGPFPDWEALAAHGYDAVHLSSRGARDVHWPRRSRGTSLNNWDVESTLWFTWAFTEPARALTPTFTQALHPWDAGDD